MPNLVKRRMIGELRAAVAEPSSFLFVGFQGLTVAEASNLRASLGEWNVRLRVVKNTVALRAFRERGVEAGEFLKGPTALVAAGEEGAIAAARVLVEAVKKHPKLELRGGFLAGRRLAPSDLPALATIPARDVFLGQVLGSVLGPASAVASLLASSLATPARLAAAHAAKAEAAGAGAPPE